VYAIVRSGSKQQKVAVGDVIEIDRVDAAQGDSVTLPEATSPTAVTRADQHVPDQQVP
jgi:ribosomal protein L21